MHVKVSQYGGALRVTPPLKILGSADISEMVENRDTVTVDD